MRGTRMIAFHVSCSHINMEDSGQSQIRKKKMPAWRGNLDMKYNPELGSYQHFLTPGKEESVLPMSIAPRKSTTLQ